MKILDTLEEDMKAAPQSDLARREEAKQLRGVRGKVHFLGAPQVTPKMNMIDIL